MRQAKKFLSVFLCASATFYNASLWASGGRFGPEKDTGTEHSASVASTSGATAAPSPSPSAPMTDVLSNSPNLPTLRLIDQSEMEDLWRHAMNTESPQHLEALYNLWHIPGDEQAHTRRDIWRQIANYCGTLPPESEQRWELVYQLWTVAQPSLQKIIRGQTHPLLFSYAVAEDSPHQWEALRMLQDPNNGWKEVCTWAPQIPQLREALNRLSASRSPHAWDALMMSWENYGAEEKWGPAYYRVVEIAHNVCHPKHTEAGDLLLTTLPSGVREALSPEQAGMFLGLTNSFMPEASTSLFPDFNLSASLQNFEDAVAAQVAAQKHAEEAPDDGDAELAALQAAQVAADQADISFLAGLRVMAQSAEVSQAMEARDLTLEAALTLNAEQWTAIETLCDLYNDQREQNTFTLQFVLQKAALNPRHPYHDKAAFWLRTYLGADNPIVKTLPGE